MHPGGMKREIAAPVMTSGELTTRDLARKGHMIHGSVGYCPCGAEIWIEYLPNRDAWRARFSDAAGREITRCPDCGRELVEEELESR